MDLNQLYNASLMSSLELAYEMSANETAKKLPAAARETLRALLQEGPLSDGDLPSKAGRDWLLNEGLAKRVIVNGEDGFQCATYLGKDTYRHLFLDGNGKVPETLKEAFAMDLTIRTLSRM